VSDTHHRSMIDRCIKIERFPIAPGDSICIADPEYFSSRAWMINNIVQIRCRYRDRLALGSDITIKSEIATVLTWCIPELIAGDGVAVSIVSREQRRPCKSLSLDRVNIINDR